MPHRTATGTNKAMRNGEVQSVDRERPEQADRRPLVAQSYGDTPPPGGNEPAGPPNSEVLDKAVRRRFTAEYKLQVLRQAAACTPGELGALLRREGLYSSHLTTWRRQRERGELAGLAPKQRGRKARQPDPAARRVAELERETGRLRRRLEQAEIIIEVQKKLAKLLGIPLSQPQSDDNA